MSNSRVEGDACISDGAIVTKGSLVSGKSYINGKAIIMGSTLRDNSFVVGNIKLYHTTLDGHNYVESLAKIIDKEEAFLDQLI